VSSSLMTLAQAQLLQPMNLSDGQMEKVLNQAMAKHIDSADIYLQSCQEESWYLEEGIVKQGDFSIDQGFGLRVISGEKVGFAYADEIDILALEKAATNARSIVHAGGQGRIKIASVNESPALYTADNPIQSLEDQQKIDLLHKADAFTRSLDPRVEQVMIRLSASYDVVMSYQSDGSVGADIRPLVGMHIRVIALENGRRESGFAGGGARCGYDLFLKEGLYETYAKKAVGQALVNLEAKPAPAGSMPVVLGPGWPAVLLHEAVGHGLEGDFNRKESSAFSGRVGEKVASAYCTVVDDGTIEHRRGSLTMDDEGVPAQRTVLIEKGILKGYMQDRFNASLMGVQSTGNGRRESYAHLPLPRMTNTYMEPGEHDPQDIISSVEKGIYAVDFSGGQVDITSGKFVFTASEAYLIENGKVTHPVKGATLVGSGPEVMQRISMVGTDLKLDSGVGSCGKEGQTVPVGVGQPTLKVDHITVGGVQIED